MENKVYQILQLRSEYVHELNRMKEYLLEHRQALTHSAGYRKAAELGELLESIQNTLVTFTRGEIDLSVIGWWKYGRAGFISGITGIDYDDVPFWFPGTVHNVADMEPGHIRANLTFFTREEMLKNVKAMINAISKDYLLGQDLEFEDIAYISIPDLESRIATGDAFKQHALEHLRSIVENFESIDGSVSVPICDLCGSQNLILTDRIELHRYIARTNGCNPKDPLREEYRSYFAVKRIDIDTHFDWTDASISVSVDMADDPIGCYRRDLNDRSDLLKSKSKDAVIYTNNRASDDITVELRDEMQSMDLDPLNRLWFAVGNSFENASHSGRNWVQRFRENPIGAGACAMNLYTVGHEDVEIFQQNILLPLLDRLPELDRKTMEALEKCVSDLSGNEEWKNAPHGGTYQSEKESLEEVHMAEQSIISSQIDNILLQRKTRAVDLRRHRNQVMELKQALIGCNQLAGKAKSIEDEKLRRECMDTLAKVKVPMKIMKQTDAILKKMDEAIKRFERESLNIATVGKARQGKSTILQAISNLGNDIIPAFDAGDCTGAVSIIHNDPSMEPGRVRVDLTFRSKEELLNIVKGYIEIINPDYLTQNPLEYDDIEYIVVSVLESGIKDGEAGKMVQLEHLRRIVDDFTGNSDSKSVSIRDLCGRSGMSLTNPDEIRKYVAQNNGKDITDPLRENYSSYLAVAKAEIYCRFPDDVGKLVLVDTIGLGDTQLGIEEAMLDTVDKQCDATIVVTKPISGVTTQDMSIYETLQQRFKHRDMKKWLFYIANLHKGVNDNVASTFHQGIISNPKYSIADCKLIDGSDSAAVRQDFLMPMLTKLMGSLEHVDNIFVQEINKLLSDLRGQIQEMLESFPKSEFGTTGGPENLKAYTLGIECYNRLTSNLDRQVRYWYEEQSKPNATLWNRVKDILNGLEGILPSEENLQQVLDQSGDLKESALWQVPLNYVRNEISDQFIALDDLMGEETQQFKNALIGELYDSLKSMGGLDGEPQQPQDVETNAAEEESIDKTRWLWDLMEPMLRDNPEYIQIYRAFQFLDQFNFNIRAQIIQEVRYQLRIINDMTTDFYMKPNYTFSKSNAGQAVHFYMTSRLAILEDALRESLMQMNKMPNQAFYAAAEEFYDRLTFASDFKNGRFVNMANIWGKFFSQYSGLIWKQELEKQEAVKRVMKEYRDYCDLLAEKLSVLAA